MIPGIVAGRAIADGPPPDSEWVTTRTFAGDVDSNGWGGYTLRQLIPATDAANVNLPAGSKVRFVLKGGFGGASIAEAYLQKAGGDDPWDFAGTPIPLTVGGSAAFSLPDGGTVPTDEVEIALSGSDDLILAFYFTSGNIVRTSAGYSNWAKWEKAGNDAGTVDAAAYSGPQLGNAYLVTKIEVLQP